MPAHIQKTTPCFCIWKSVVPWWSSWGILGLRHNRPKSSPVNKLRLQWESLSQNIGKSDGGRHLILTFRPHTHCTRVLMSSPPHKPASPPVSLSSTESGFNISVAISYFIITLTISLPTELNHIPWKLYVVTTHIPRANATTLPVRRDRSKPDRGGRSHGSAYEDPSHTAMETFVCLE